MRLPDTFSVEQAVAGLPGDVAPGPIRPWSALPTVGGALTGKEAIPAVVLMENHDAAYFAWRDAGVRNRVLVHVDAHHDAWWVDKVRDVTIANFVCRALREDLVREMHWVVPDGSWQSPRARTPVLRHVDLLIRKYYGSRKSLRWEGNQLVTALLGKPFRVGPLSTLPRLDEPVLLDIDVDYLVIPRVSYGVYDRHSPVPWCWPEELLAGLAAREVRTDLATVVYSVEGGYTPQKWKFLGDELVCRLQSPGDADRLAGFQRMRAAVLARHKGDHAGALRLYEEVARCLPNSAAPRWHLAELHQESGQLTAARDYGRQALILEPAYRNPYNTLGWVRLREGNHAGAEQEFRRRVELDPDDPYSLAGLGRLAARKKDWAGAEARLRRAIACEPDLVDAHRWLASVLSRQGRPGEAIAEYRLALKLSLAGRRSLDAGIVSATGQQPLWDPHHGEMHAELALLLAQQGDVPGAINGLRLAVAAGSATPRRLCWLARLCLRQRRYVPAVRALTSAVLKFPQDGWAWLWWTIRRGAGRAQALWLAAWNRRTPE